MLENMLLMQEFKLTQSFSLALHSILVNIYFTLYTIHIAKLVKTMYGKKKKMLIGSVEIVQGYILHCINQNNYTKQ